MYNQIKTIKILDYVYRKSVFISLYGHPSRFDEYRHYGEELDQTELSREEQFIKYQKSIFLLTLRSFKKLGVVTKEESEIFFENFKKIYSDSSIFAPKDNRFLN
jgi:hypothetical protein